jgi:hypothetical protein
MVSGMANNNLDQIINKKAALIFTQQGFISNFPNLRPNHVVPSSKINLIARIFNKLDSYRAVNYIVNTLNVIIFIGTDHRQRTVVEHRNMMLCMSASKTKPVHQNSCWEDNCP